MDALRLTTGGLVKQPRGETISTHGYIFNVSIEVIPIEEVRSGGGAPDEAGESLKKKKRKLIKVTVSYEGKDYIKKKVVNDDVDVTTKDIKINMDENKVPQITIDVERARIIR